VDEAMRLDYGQDGSGTRCCRACLHDRRVYGQPKRFRLALPV
jgi:hypothetical protein